MFGARAAADILLQQQPDLNISLNFVWIKMIDSDDESTAILTAQSIDDDRVQHFYDPDRLAGKAIAQSFGQRDVIAWDMYLFFSVGSVWRLRPPTPIAWAHQMGDHWPEHYRWEDDLVKELNQIVEQLK